MATAEELLAQMEENPNAKERTIEVPESEKKFGTESDKKSERKHLKMGK